MSILNSIGAFDLDSEPNDYAKMIIFGNPGAGKTTLASTIGRVGKTLMVDLPGEQGLSVVRGTPWSKNLVPVRPKTPQDMADLIDHLISGKHDFKAVVVDSFSAWQRMAERHVLGNTKATGLTAHRPDAPAMKIQDWGRSKSLVEDLARSMFSLADSTLANPMHVIFTCHRADETDKDGNIVTRKLAVQSGSVRRLEGEADHVIFCDVESNYEADPLDDGTFPMRHVVYISPREGYQVKSRQPRNMRGKIPPVWGRTANTPLDLIPLLRVLGTAGIPAAKKTSK